MKIILVGDEFIANEDMGVKRDGRRLKYVHPHQFMKKNFLLLSRREQSDSQESDSFEQQRTDIVLILSFQLTHTSLPIITLNVLKRITKESKVKRDFQ